MSISGNGRDNRIRDLNSARSPRRRRKPIDLAPDEARALIDAVFRSYGLDPAKLTDPYGWRHLTLGSANGLTGVVEWQPQDHYLVVLAPILEIEADPASLSPFYQLLLELNHDGTLGTRFSIHDNTVYVSLARPVRGLDEEEVDDAIRAVMVIADSYTRWLQGALDQTLGLAPPPFSELPNIKMTPNDGPGTGPMFYRARYYHGGLGRFVSADTIVPNPGDSEAFNRYAYCHDNPSSMSTPQDTSTTTSTNWIGSMRYSESWRMTTI